MILTTKFSIGDKVWVPWTEPAEGKVIPRETTVGTVIAEVGDDLTRTEYMMRETGIGTGIIYDSTEVFANRDECQAAIDYGEL